VTVGWPYFPATNSPTSAIKTKLRNGPNSTSSYNNSRDQRLLSLGRGHQVPLCWCALHVVPATEALRQAGSTCRNGVLFSNSTDTGVGNSLVWLQKQNGCGLPGHRPTARVTYVLAEPVLSCFPTVAAWKYGTVCTDKRIVKTECKTEWFLFRQWWCALYSHQTSDKLPLLKLFNYAIC
jgi:hypothetical protein